MSEAASTSTPGGANAPVAVGKGASSESATRGMLENAAAAFVVIAGILVGNTISIGLTNANMEKYAGQTNTNIEKTNTNIEKTNTNIEKTNANIEKYFGETNLSLVELRHDVGTLSTKTNYLLGSVIGTAVIGLATLATTIMLGKQQRQQ